VRKQLRTFLLGIPGAAIALGTFVCIWETPRNWIGERFTDLGAAMSNPWVTVLVTLLLVAYSGTVIWTFFEPRPPSAVELRALEAARERDAHRRQLIADGRRLVAEFNLQVRANTLYGYLKYQPQYGAIRAQLSPEFVANLEHPRLLALSDTTKDGRVHGFMQELDRLEREWGLA
jgi:hypothetical protein